MSRVPPPRVSSTVSLELSRAKSLLLWFEDYAFNYTPSELFNIQRNYHLRHHRHLNLEEELQLSCRRIVGPPESKRSHSFFAAFLHFKLH